MDKWPLSNTTDGFSFIFLSYAAHYAFTCNSIFANIAVLDSDLMKNLVKTSKFK